ncbi:hypothetical protein EDB86DRAFT_1365053 [Lactarius hatsudake]|nr:hypothetical protein EDB86DRAFT_1365053 [Lactarius hatsudake]
MRACGRLLGGELFAQYIAECDWYATNSCFIFILFASLCFVASRTLAAFLLIGLLLPLPRLLFIIFLEKVVPFLWTHRSTVCL